MDSSHPVPCAHVDEKNDNNTPKIVKDIVMNEKLSWLSVLLCNGKI